MSEPKYLSVINKYKKEHGNGSIGLLSESFLADVKTTSTGSLLLDKCIGGTCLSGLPEGRIIEFYGPEASMKTTTALYGMKKYLDANPTKLGLFLDVEQAFDKNLAYMIGIDPSKVVFTQPETTEDTLQLLEDFIQTGEFGYAIVDSVAAMIPKSELEGDFGDNKIGVQARLMSQGMRKINGAINKNKCTTVFINQTRDKIGVVYGSPETTTGGNALKFYSSLRIRFQSSKMQGAEEQGRIVKAKLIKSKISASAVGNTAEIPYYYALGFDNYLELVELADKLKVIDKKGSWYSDGETKLGQGALKVREFLIDNQDYYEELLDRVKKSLDK